MATMHSISKAQKTILVTGGAGFIGHHLVNYLATKGYRIIIIDNLSNGKIKNISQALSRGCIFLKKDIRDKILLKIIKKYSPDIIVHLAAIHSIPYCTKHPALTFDVNVNGTRNILDIATKLRVKKYIFASTAAVYKPSIKAHSELSPVYPIDSYGLSKQKAENLVISECRKNFLPFTIFRLFNVYGSGDLSDHIIPKIIERLEKSSKLTMGNLKTYRDYVEVNDVVSAFYKVISSKTTPSKKIFNIGSGVAYSGQDIIDIISRIIHRTLSVRIKKNLVRNNDRTHLLANYHAMSRVYGWRPTISLKKGLYSLIRRYE